MIDLLALFIAESIVFVYYLTATVVIIYCAYHCYSVQSVAGKRDVEFASAARSYFTFAVASLSAQGLCAANHADRTRVAFLQ